MPDKYTALWLSHSSIRDFVQCPRAYYLSNVYKNPQTGRKIQIVSPALTIGTAVHDVLEQISTLPTKDRFRTSLVELLQTTWQRFAGERGGFGSAEAEAQAKERAREMLVTVMQNPGPLAHPAIKLKGDLSFYWFSESENMILCGKLDWLEHLPDTDSVHILDFKTGKSREAGSLQLPIYSLLASNVQQRPVSRISYWFLESARQPTQQPLPDLEQARDQVMSIAKQIKLARKLQNFKCPEGQAGCWACRNLERVVAGEGKLVASDPRGRDVFLLEDQSPEWEAMVID